MNDLRASVGVVLAGGDSSRMGRDKATLSLDGRTLLSRSVGVLSTVCERVIVADRGRALEPGLESVEDGPGRGPAAGILGAAAHVREAPLLVLACDLPNVSTDVLQRLQERRHFDWHLPRHGGGIEPLCALYGQRALHALRGQAERGELSLQSLLGAALRIGFLEGRDLEAFGDPGELFLNLNHPQDAARLDCQ